MLVKFHAVSQFLRQALAAKGVDASLGAQTAGTILSFLFQMALLHDGRRHVEIIEYWRLAQDGTSALISAGFHAQILI